MISRRFTLVACLLIAGGLTVAHWSPRVSSRAPAPAQPATAPAQIARTPALARTRTNPLDELVRRWRAAATEDARRQLRAEFDELLARSNPADFTCALPMELRDEPFFQNALQRWTSDSPAEALQWLQESPDSERFAPLIDSAASDWARRDPSAALQWALNQPAGAGQDHLLSRVLVGVAELDPKFAVDSARELLPAGTAQREAIGLVLYSWFDQAPADVSSWLGDLPKGDERDLILTRLLGWQLEKNPAQVGGLLAEISNDRLRAQATLNLIHHWARDDFDNAAAWALRVSSVSLRTQLLSELARIANEEADPLR